jgi:hypothetical protein
VIGLPDLIGSARLTAIAVHGPATQGWSAQGEAFDHLRNLGRQCVLPTITARLAHQADEAIAPIGVQPALQGA